MIAIIVMFVFPLLARVVFSIQNVDIAQLSFSQNAHKRIEFTEIVGAFPTSPTYAALYSYSDSTCGTQLTEVRTGLLNTCFKGKDGTTMKTTCESSGLTQTFYSDNACTTVSTTSPVVFPTTCSASGSGAIYDSYEVADCTNIGTSPYFAYPSNFVVHSWYNSADCASDEVIITRGFIDDYCLQASATASLKWNFPVDNIWTSSSTCEGTPQAQNAFSGSCILADDDGYATYETYNNWILTSSGSSSDDSLSTGTIVGIAIGVFGGIVIIGALIYYFFIMKHSPLSQQGDSKV